MSAARPAVIVASEESRTPPYRAFWAECLNCGWVSERTLIYPWATRWAREHRTAHADTHTFTPSS